MSESTEMTPVQVGTTTPGCAALPDAQFLAVGDAARLAVLDARASLQVRLVAGEGLTTIEADLGPLIERVLAPLRVQLLAIPPESGIKAAYTAAVLLLQETLTGDLRVAQQLRALASAAQASSAVSPAPRRS